MKTHGGSRPGAGKPKGVRWPSTLKRDAAKAAYQQEILSALRPLVQTQLAEALGRFASVVVVEIGDRGFTLRKVADEQELEALVAAGRGYRVLIKEPDGAMSRYLTDQAVGRADAPATSTTVTTEAGKTIVRHEHVTP